ncbi:MAG TPA: hypothetical protein PK781_05605 [Terrimesophilobacter sp.]|nr:hypothetical protein [Terrimesophilobacter sp.]
MVTANCLLHADFSAPLGDIGGVPQVGIPAGTTYRVNVQLTVPLGLPATWAYNGVPVDNTATADAETSLLPATSTATVTVDIPIVVDVAPTKSWTPSNQLYNPGEASTFTIGAQNTSNLPAESLVLQDPVVAVDGATELDTSNPFTFVDFTGLCTPSELPAGADLVQVDLYVENPVNSWNWVTGSPAATPTLPSYTGEVGGIRLTYTSTSGATIASMGTAAAQCVTVAQRADNRTTGTSLITGATADNTVGATLTVPGYPPATDTADAALTIGPLNVVVSPGKTISPAVIPAGADFTVNLSALNSSNGPLTSLAITEPGPSATPFLSEELTFDGFTSWTWPDGATAGTFEWHFNTAASQSVPITELGGAPAVPTPASSDWITGFTVTYTGLIPVGISAGFIYTVNTDPTMIDVAAPQYADFLNVIEVTGTNPAGTATESAQDDVRIYYPEIELDIEKTIRPGLVTPGGTVVAELETETATNSARVNPTQIVIEDVWDGTADTDFWNAFRARELAFIQIPTDSTLTVRYTTETPATDPIAWTDIVVGTTGTAGLFSHDLTLLPDGADDITGFQFVFDSTDPDGFSQGTIVKPNIVFEAASTLRTGGPTTLVPGAPVDYDNIAVANGEGESGGEIVTGVPVDDDATTQIIRFGGDGTGTGPGVDTLLSDKDWVGSNWSTDLTILASQSGATARTAHGWGVTVPGYDSVVLSDALPGSETSPGSTVFQAFDLTGIRAITFAQDPLLQWDTITQVQIYVGGTWTTVPAPSGTWMSTAGFKGYNPTGANLTTLRSATGLRITVEANDSARAASTDPGRPAVGAGVAWGAAERPLWLQWQLRNTMRVPSGSGWVAATQSFNHADPGTIRNDFRVAGTAGVDTFTRDESDTVVLIDNPPGVGIAKSATTTPATTPPLVVVPHPGDVDPADYPTVRFTVDAWNTASARASYLRVSDPMSGSCSPTCVTPANYWDPDVFTPRTYDPVTNPFERFTITGVGFTIPGAVPIDPDETMVALWRYDALTDTTSVDTVTMAQLITLGEPALSDVVGIGIVYQSTNPAVTGGLIPQGSATTNRIRMTIDTQLRATLRSDDSAVMAGGLEIENDAQAQSYDPILHAAATPYAGDFAAVELSSARLDVTASKTITPGTIFETNPNVPVTVTLGATDGDATAAAQMVTITDTDANFWTSFELVALGSVTRPAGADLARVDVQLDNTSTWIQGAPVAAPGAPALPASLTLPDDLERITGIRFVFNNDPVRPFSATAPSASWSAQALFTVQARDAAVFPSTVNNAITVVAEHTGLPAANDADADDIVLTTGTPRIDVQKEPVTGGPKIVEPGVSYPWTLEFENVGTAFFTVNDVIDNLGPNLQFDGSEPLYETNSATVPITGITVSQATASEISFVFPADSVLAPGEWYRITLNLSLLPGLTPAQQAVNQFYVDTNAIFAAGDCVNTSGNGQGVLAGLGVNQCGTSNFVSPQAGPLLFVEKEVRGEIDGTLVDGASNLINPALPCSTIADDFHRSNCVAYTTIGATDEWRVGAVNTGTIAYETLAFVDVLPTIGDRLLATGSARQSNWRPVFDLDFGIQLTAVPGLPGDGIPPGTTMTFEVTTDTAPCVGTGVGSAWPSDLTCAGNTWESLSTYSGSATDVTGIRISLDFSTSVAGVLPPGGSVHFLHRTINTPWTAGDVPTAQAIRPQLNTGPSLKAWNQVGAVATQAGTGAPLSRAPQRVGVQLLTGSAAVEKTVSGVVSLAPNSVTADAVCTVPTGEPGQRAPVDLATMSLLTVPVGGTARLDGVPLGAECDFVESGALGHFGEAERTPSGPQTVQIVTAGAVADAVPLAQSVSMNNRYAWLASTGVEVREPIALGLTLLGLGVLVTLFSRRKRAA